jgi:hypothetical protein
VNELSQGGTFVGEVVMLLGLLPVAIVLAAAVIGAVWLLAGLGVANMKRVPRQKTSRTTRGQKGEGVVCRDCGKPRDGCERRCPICGCDGWLSAGVARRRRGRGEVHA